MQRLNSEECVRRCLGGDSQAFEPLVRRYQNAAYATALRYVRDRMEAQEMVQDAFVTAYCRLGQLREAALFGPWLQRIVGNRCKNYLRECNRLSPLDAAEKALEQRAQRAHASRLRHMDLWEAVAALSERYRETALMYYLSGFSYQEIAEYLEVPVSTVRGRLQQARIRLRESLETDEGLQMEKIDVAEKVQDVVCQIETKSIREIVPAQDVDNIVLYCGLHVELEIRPAENGETQLEGTLSSIGLSPQAARESVEKIEIEMDQVESFLESGPHEGEVFLGTSGDGDKIWGNSASSSGLWKGYVKEQYTNSSTYNGVRGRDIFPYLNDCVNAMPAAMKGGLGRAARVTVLRREMEDIILPREAWTPEVKRVFSPNNTSPERVHGSVGFAHLTLYVPEGKTVTVVEAHKVRASGLKNALHTISSYCEEIEDITGDVCIFDGACGVVRNVRGRFYQRYHEYNGTEWADNLARRNVQRVACSLEKIDGEIDVDVAQVPIEALELAGRARIYNRYGSTVLRQSRCNKKDRIALETCSGEIRLRFGKELVDKSFLSAVTLCGPVDFRALPDDEFITQNDRVISLITTLQNMEDIREAQVFMASESGAITMEAAE